MSKKDLLEAIKGKPDLVERLLVVAESPNMPRCLSPQEVYEAVAHLLVGQPEERLVCVAMDRHNRILAIKELTRGSDGFTVVDPRQIYRWALQQGRSGAFQIALAHNHPSGDPTPSEQDHDVTRRVAAAGRVLGITLVDHLVVGHGNWTSLAEQGHLPFTTGKY